MGSRFADFWGDTRLPSRRRAQKHPHNTCQKWIPSPPTMASPGPPAVSTHHKTTSCASVNHWVRTESVGCFILSRSRLQHSDTLHRHFSCFARLIPASASASMKVEEDRDGPCLIESSCFFARCPWEICLRLQWLVCICGRCSRRIPRPLFLTRKLQQSTATGRVVLFHHNRQSRRNEKRL